jgi:hypothetical protein
MGSFGWYLASVLIILVNFDVKLILQSQVVVGDQRLGGADVARESALRAKRADTRGIWLFFICKKIKYKREDQEWFHFYANLYIKYIDIFRKLEDCYDQIVHPQKRLLLKEMLENCMVRLYESK